MLMQANINNELEKEGLLMISLVPALKATWFNMKKNMISETAPNFLFTWL